MFNEKSIIDFLKQQLYRFPSIERFFIAYSGGVDSSVLLHLLAKYQAKLNVTVHAIHIHHGLNEAADTWQKHVEEQCQKKNIPIQTFKVSINTIGESIEAKAREARYDIFKKLIDEKSALLLAHHQDDQAETLLLQLFRGAGLKGLAAMSDACCFSKGYLFRPFLNYSRASIVSYAMAENLTWVYDTSNDDKRFDRNFLRHDIMPLLKMRWPAINQTLARTANLCAHSNQLLQKLIQENLEQCLKEEPFQLSITQLKKFNEFEQHEILRAWFQKLHIIIPNRKHMQQISKLINAKENANPLVRWKNVSLRRYRNVLFVFKGNVEREKTHTNKFISDVEGEVIVLPDQSKILIERKIGKGVSLNKISLEELTVSFRNENGKRLKKIFQQFSIPPWRRSNIPLVFFKEKLIAVVGIWIHPAFKAKKDEMGVEFLILSAQGETR